MNTNTAKFLFEGISADVVRYLVERNDMDCLLYTSDAADD